MSAAVTGRGRHTLVPEHAALAAGFEVEGILALHNHVIRDKALRNPLETFQHAVADSDHLSSHAPLHSHPPMR
jgi:hypothetical protein